MSSRQSAFCSFGDVVGEGDGAVYAGFDSVYFCRIMEFALHKRFVSLRKINL